MAKSKLYWEKEKKRGEKEGKKREKEKRIKEDRRKKRIKRERKRKKGEKGRVKQSEIKKNMGEYLLILYTLSPLTSPGTCPSSWSSGGGACCADFQMLALGGAALPSAWCRAQWGLFTP